MYCNQKEKTTLSKFLHYWEINEFIQVVNYRISFKLSILYNKN